MASGSATRHLRRFGCGSHRDQSDFDKLIVRDALNGRSRFFDQSARDGVQVAVPLLGHLAK